MWRKNAWEALSSRVSTSCKTWEWISRSSGRTSLISWGALSGQGDAHAALRRRLAAFLQGGAVEVAAPAHDKRDAHSCSRVGLSLYLKGLCTPCGSMWVHVGPYLSLLPDSHERGKSRGPFIPQLKTRAFWPLL